KTESRYKNKLTAESCFHLHKILDSVIKTVPDKEESLLPMRQWTFFIYRGFTIIHYVKTGLQGQQDN
ncbi:hypothetical protein AAA215_20380, partial [Phocaeicola vulgatus]